MNEPQSITPRELIEETRRCTHAREKTDSLLERINAIGDELLLINGFLTLRPEMQRIPPEKIQQLLAEYKAGDGESCRRAIEQNLQFHIGKIRKRITKNDEILTSAREARKKRLSPSTRTLKQTPEQRLAALESMIGTIESLQQRLGHIASQYTQEPLEESRVQIKKSSHKRMREETAKPDAAYIERQKGAVYRDLSIAEETTQELLRRTEVPPEGQSLFTRRLTAALRSNSYSILQARAFLGKIDPTSQVAQEIQRKIETLEVSNDSIKSVLAQLPPSEATPEKEVSIAPRFEDFSSLARRAEQESRQEQREEAVQVQAEIYKRVVLPAERELRGEQQIAQERLHERGVQVQSQEARRTRRFMAVSGAVGTAGAFLAQDAVHVAAVAASQPTVLEGVAAGVGALTQLHPFTQAMAIGAVAMTEVPSWDWTQRCAGVAVGSVASFFIGPMGGFAVGTVAGKYGPAAVRRAGAAVSGIANPALRRLAQARILQRMARRSSVEERSPQVPQPPGAQNQQQGGDKMDIS